jgi:hypothetical protein
MRRNPARTGEAALMLARMETLRKRKEQNREKRNSAPADAPIFHRVHAPPADRGGVVTIVSGLPRSGTSMMMQMLAAAGLAPYTDGHRPPDSDNPRGYFEHRQATTLHRDASWIPEARGKVVKIVATLLPHLPSGEHYRIVLMRRNLEEVVSSQRAMLDRLKREGARLDAESLLRAYTSQLVRLQQWLQSHPEIAVLSVDYSQALASPAETATRLAEFLGHPFDAAQAAAAIAPSLRRQTTL